MSAIPESLACPVCLGKAELVIGLADQIRHHCARCGLSFVVEFDDGRDRDGE